MRRRGEGVSRGGEVAAAVCAQLTDMLGTKWNCWNSSNDTVLRSWENSTS